jgi:hypothetical protein
VYGYRADETWHRLREWTAGSTAAERLAAQILLADGYTGVDPSHPLGGPDGGKDMLCERDGLRWAAGVWFPRGERSPSDLKAKFSTDLGAACERNPDVGAFVFVANQEIRLADRRGLLELSDIEVELLHLERIAAILDQPHMHDVREQYLGIERDRSEGVGGDGGSGRIVGKRGRVIGGPGGRGGVTGRGGSGGGGEVVGDDALIIGGAGGDAGQADGRGGRGAPSAFEREPDHLDSIPSHLWGAGRGGLGANHPEYERRLEVLKGAREDYRAVFPERWIFIEAGVEQVPVRWVNKRLQELGEEWRVERGDEGYVLPPLPDTCEPPRVS